MKKWLIVHLQGDHDIVEAENFYMKSENLVEFYNGEESVVAMYVLSNIAGFKLLTE